MIQWYFIINLINENNEYQKADSDYWVDIKLFNFQFSTNDKKIDAYTELRSKSMKIVLFKIPNSEKIGK